MSAALRLVGTTSGHIGFESLLGRGGMGTGGEAPLTDDVEALLVEAYEAVKAKQADVKDL